MALIAFRTVMVALLLSCSPNVLALDDEGIEFGYLMEQTTSGPSQAVALPDAITDLEESPFFGPSYFLYTGDESRCFGDGTMGLFRVRAEFFVEEGSIQTVEFPARGFPEESIARSGPAGGFVIWNDRRAITLEGDNTAFETIRGRLGDNIDGELIFSSTVRYDCTGKMRGEAPDISYEYFPSEPRSRRLTRPVPAVGTWGMILMVLMLTVFSGRVLSGRPCR